ncbi:L-demethylnoviosyl transferase [Baekduia alba]|uniref:glycosyltransferase n=1 Tax=Baekduia alba TaxID=2997333 RepID=UPI00234204D1|nr:glycosyltransferase [Baekduia alba]WCB94125.1 L-demethylnoviosyl transferase [Baekduia alba]
MRILLTTRGSAGHVLPLAPFGHAARRAGHDVLVVAQRQHEANVARTGLPHAPVDDPDQAEWRARVGAFMAMGIDDANCAMVGEFFGRVDTTAALPGLRAVVESWRPDLIVRESWEYASTLVADLYDIPVVRVALGLGALDAWSNDLVAPALDVLRDEIGLPADPEAARLHGTPLFTMMPAALDGGDRQAEVRRFRQADPVLTVRDSAPLPQWWPDNADPLVYFSLGSVAGQPHMPYFPALYRMVVDELSSLPIRLLVTTGDLPDPAALGPVPANVHVARWVPQEAVLPHAAAAIVHGGYGSTLGALAHGVPTVVIPLFSIDQWANADAVQRAGAGIALAADRDTRLVVDLPNGDAIAGLAPAVLRLLTDRTPRRRAVEISAAMAALPPVDEAIDAFEDVVGVASRG